VVTNSLDFVVRHGYVLLFFWILAEQAALPVPSAPLLLACGALARVGRLNPFLVVVSGLAACLAADTVWFQLGRARGTKVLRFVCRVALEPDSCVRRTENAFLRWGSRSLLVAKFIPGLNAVAAPLAGSSGLSRLRFLLFDTAGALLWIAAYAGVGYAFGDQLEVIGVNAERMGHRFALLLAGAFAAWVVWKFIQRRRFIKKLAITRVTAEDLQHKLDAGEDFLVVDLRSGLEAKAQPIPGALRIPMDKLLVQQQEIPRDRDVVLCCSCPNEASSARVALMLQSHGITRAHPLKGGADALDGLRLPNQNAE
jgi:membrane protein DedA with SNARE-associated domain/rhodanese-related sulfurtransferase